MNRARYTNVRFVGILDFATVTALSYDAVAGHAQMFPYATGSEIPKDYREYDYGKFIRDDNTVVYLGLPWVKASTITENNQPSYNVLLIAPEAAQVESLRQMMVASGIEKFEISIV